jgi:hypothetical protein
MRPLPLACFSLADCDNKENEAFDKDVGGRNTSGWKSRGRFRAQAYECRARNEDFIFDV